MERMFSPGIGFRRMMLLFCLAFWSVLGTDTGRAAGTLQKSGEGSSAAPVIEVLSPQGYDTCPGDSLITVQWRADLMKAGTVVWFELWKGSKRIQLWDWDYSPTGEGTKKVYLPLQEKGWDYRIKAFSLWNWRYYAFSGYFAITGGAVKIQSPNGGQTWRPGTREWVWWQTNPKISGTAVRLELWRGGKKAATLGTDWNPLGEAVKMVNVPALPPATDYTLRAVSLFNPALWDESDGTIRIAAATAPAPLDVMPALSLPAQAPEIPARRAMSGASEIEQIGWLALNGGRCLAAAGNCLVASHGTTEKFIDLIDVSNPTQPTLLSSLKLTSASTINSIQVRENRAYVLAVQSTGSGAIYTVDISRLDQPRLVHILDMEEIIPEDGGIYGDYSFVYGYYDDSPNTDDLSIIDIGEGHNPRILDYGISWNYNNPTYPRRRMSVIGPYAYIFETGDYGTHVYRLGGGGFDDFGQQANVDLPLQRVGTTGYGLTYSGELSILNMTHPWEPEIVDTMMPTDSWVWWSDLAVSGGIICLGSESEKTVAFLDYRNPTMPTLLAQGSYPKKVHRVLAYQGNFYSMHEDGLRVWHFNDSPVVIISPNGGEILKGDSIVTVQWQFDVKTAGTVAWFELWRGNRRIQFLDWDYSPTGMGTKKIYLPLQEGGWETEGDLGDLMVPEMDYRIKAVSLWDWRYSDFSDSNFSITGGAVKVHSPNGGQTWRTGTREGIWWQTNPRVSGTAVRLELWRGGKKAAALGTDWDPLGEAQKVVLVPVLPPAGDYKLRAVSLFNPALWDESDGPIAVAPWKR